MNTWIKSLYSSIFLNAKYEVETEEVKPLTDCERLKALLDELHIHPIVGREVRHCSSIAASYRCAKDNYLNSYAKFILPILDSTDNLALSVLEILLKSGQLSRHRYLSITKELHRYENRELSRMCVSA